MARSRLHRVDGWSRRGLTVVACVAVVTAAAVTLGRPSVARSVAPVADAATGPATVALGDVVVHRTEWATLRYRVEDATSAEATVQLVVKDLRGRLVVVLKPAGLQPTNVARSFRFRVSLAAGRYRFFVYAIDTAGEIPSSVGSRLLTVLSPRPPLFPTAADIARAMAFLRARRCVSALGVVDSRGVLHGYNLDRQFTSASVVKAMLLVAYLRAHVTISAGARATLTRMIERSDNAAAYAIFAAVHADGLRRLARLAGMRHFTVGRDVLHSFITAGDQARYFYSLDRYLPAPHRDFARHLLSHIIPGQSWGIPRAARPAWRVYFKGGWWGAYLTCNQVARLERGNLMFSVAVLTTQTPGGAYALASLQGVGERLLGHVR